MNTPRVALCGHACNGSLVKAPSLLALRSKEKLHRRNRKGEFGEAKETGEGKTRSKRALVLKKEYIVAAEMETRFGRLFPNLPDGAPGF